MMKVKVFCFIALFASVCYTQTINLRLSTSFYTWERFDTILASGEVPSTTHIRGYQNLLFDFSHKNWSFNTLAQIEEDIINSADNGFNYRFYNLYIKGANLLNLFDVKIGRQYVFAGVGKGTMDGLYLKVKAGKFKQYQLALYGGVPTQQDYELTEYPVLKNNYMIGVQATYYGVKGLYLGLSYMNKHHKPPSYLAFRLDTAQLTTTKIIDVDSPADQLGGVDISYSYKQRFTAFAKAYYDFNLKKLYRGVFNTRFIPVDKLGITLGYLYRQPQFSYNRILWVFNQKPNQEIEGGIDYTIWDDYNFYAKVSNVLYEEDNSLRLQAGFTHTNYGFSFIKYMGYAGESDGVSGYYQRELFASKLSTSLSLNFSNYRLGDYDTEKVNSFDGALGITYRPEKHFTIDVQGQFITNRIYKSDTRFLVGIHYWLFKKF